MTASHEPPARSGTSPEPVDRPRRSRALRAAAVGLIAAVATIMASLVVTQPALADTAPPPGVPQTVSADPLPTVQMDGVAWVEQVVGNTVYVGGQFANARPAGSASGTNLTPRANMLAFDLTTGALNTSFNPGPNAQVKALAVSPDGTRLYVGGSFTTIGGATRYRLAAFNTATGALITSFVPVINATVNGIVATNSTVYAVGAFSSAGNQARTYAAAFSATNGAILPWAPTVAGGTAQHIVMSPDGSKVVIGGDFTSVNGSSNPGYGLAALTPDTATMLPWNVNGLIRNGGTQAAIESLHADASGLYGSGYVFGQGGNLEGSFRADWTNGDLVWVEDCHGDTYDVTVLQGVEYAVGHPHYCGNIGGFPQTSPTWTFHRALAFTTDVRGTITADPYGYYNYAGNPRPDLLNWYPDVNVGSYTGQSQGPWSNESSGNYLILGGEFTQVQGKQQQGLVRFAMPSVAPLKIGPQIPAASYTPNVISLTAGTARIAFKTNWDPDNETLTYDVIRGQATGHPIYTTQVTTPFWQPKSIVFTDTGQTPGTTQTYRIRATDPNGNSVMGPSVSVTIASSGSMTPYASNTLGNSPEYYWPLNEGSGTNAYDWANGNDATLNTGVTRSGTGPLNPDSTTAAVFDGQSDGFFPAPSNEDGPNTFTAQAWIKTTTTQGGKILGFGNQSTGNSSSYDRHIYMANNGRVYFGVYPGSVQTLSTPTSLNDGQWHQITATLGSGGMVLYVDGLRVASRTDVTTGQAYNGYWRVGGDNLNGWNSQPSSNYFAGTISQVAIYQSVLSKSQVSASYQAAGYTLNIPPVPADAYGASVRQSDPDLYWRLADTGSTAADSGAYGQTGTYRGGYTHNQTGALFGVSNAATAFNGNTGIAVSNQQVSNPTTYSLEAWFKTNTTNGGKLIGFGDAQTGLSSNYDRHVYMQNDGRLVFGTWTGQANTITSPNPLNDNKWHYVVATQASDGMVLYVDGVAVGTNPQTQAQSYSGYWRIGGDNTWGSNSPYFKGTLDEVAVYSTELSAGAVANHYSLGTTGNTVNQPPTASFTATSSGLIASVDASASTDADGTIASYSWNWGDGATSTGVTSSHTYATAGTYAVTLTVTDNGGATGTSSQSVTVAPIPNQPPTSSFTVTPTNLSVSTDASASTDPDGTIIGYAWDWGDGSTGTGVTASHTYAAGGTYTITLTTTDNSNASTGSTKQVTVTPPNQPPTAAFTTSANGLALSVDGSTSSDPDGTIASYAWNFGDGATATGATASHTYAAAGTYTVTLVVTDNQSATGTTSQQVTVAKANVAPTAAFTSSATGLAVSVDGSTSSDPDGTIASYAWDFGDGATAAGATASHTYAAAGTYTITLVVTDNQSATGTTAKQVVVTATTGAVLAADAFGRTVANGWGTADTGGAWTATGTAANFSVGNGVGSIAVPVGMTRTERLGAVSSAASDVQASFTVDRAATGGGQYVGLIGRQVGSTAFYGRAWVKAGGAVQIQILEGGTTLKALNVAGLTWTPGMVLNVRMTTVGDGTTTTMNAKVWDASQAEPATWQVTATSTTAAMQPAGSVGVVAYVSASATDPTTNITVDNFSAKSAQ
ncbi:PKD domain-containing protein [Microbacterium sp. X-17]|uniref:PKD domain-containing protein n=1 Tax=Microbacterium sp. X-17 TaxID=3144404 RepID=UPI0031F4DA20